MQIGNRLFPYPVVNRNRDLTDYRDEACYEIAFGDLDNPIKEERHNLILQNIHIKLADDVLFDYVEKGLLQPILVVECPESVFRKTYELSLSPREIIIPLKDLTGKVTISSYLYATEIINDYNSSNFVDDFNGINFDLNQYDIVGVDDGFYFTIQHDDFLDNESESIFIVQPGNREQKYLQYVANKGDSKIYITLPKEQYEEYHYIKDYPEFKNILMGIIVTPILVDVFNNIQAELNDYNDMVDIIESYPWFKSVKYAYKNARKTELTLEIFGSTKALEFAQIVFNNMNINVIQDVKNMIMTESDRGVYGEN